MCKVFAAVLSLHADLQAARLCVSEIRAGADFKILLLSRRPRLDVERLHLQVREIAGAALKRADRNLHRAEQIDGILPELIEPVGAVLRLADDDHLLLLELMDAVHASLLDAVRAFLLAEAGRIAGERERQLLLRNHLVDEAADHAVLRRADQVEVFSLDLVHHGVHLIEAHDAGHDVASDHKWRHHIGESSSDHEVSRVSDHCGMKPRDVAHQIVEAVSGHAAGGVEVDAREAGHDVRVIGDLKIRNERLAEFLDLHVFRIIFSDRDGRIDDLRNHHHALPDLFLDFLLFLFKLVDAGALSCDLLFDRHRLVLLAFLHEASDLLRGLVPLRLQRLYFLLDLTVPLVKGNHFVHERQLLILKLFADILFDGFRVLSQKLNINHVLYSSTYVDSYTVIGSCLNSGPPYAVPGGRAIIHQSDRHCRSASRCGVLPLLRCSA